MSTDLSVITKMTQASTVTKVVSGCIDGWIDGWMEYTLYMIILVHILPFISLKFTARITLGYRRKNVTMGIVEVYQKYFWTTLCANGFDQRDADVICRQLGYSSARVLLPGQFGRSPRYVHTVNIKCTGNETDILDCEHEMGFCSSYNYASVLCSHQDASPSMSSRS